MEFVVGLLIGLTVGTSGCHVYHRKRSGGSRPRDRPGDVHGLVEHMNTNKRHPKAQQRDFERQPSHSRSQSSRHPRSRSMPAADASSHSRHGSRSHTPRQNSISPARGAAGASGAAHKTSRSRSNSHLISFAPRLQVQDSNSQTVTRSGASLALPGSARAAGAGHEHVAIDIFSDPNVSYDGYDAYARDGSAGSAAAGSTASTRPPSVRNGGNNNNRPRRSHGSKQSFYNNNNSQMHEKSKNSKSSVKQGHGRHGSARSHSNRSKSPREGQKAGSARMAYIPRISPTSQLAQLSERSHSNPNRDPYASQQAQRKGSKGSKGRPSSARIRQFSESSSYREHSRQVVSSLKAAQSGANGVNAVNAVNGVNAMQANDADEEKQEPRERKKFDTTRGTVLTLENMETMRQVREQEKIVKLAAEAVVREREQLDLMKEELKHGYAVKMQDIGEKDRFLKQQIGLYKDALKHMSQMDGKYAEMIANKLKMDQMEHKMGAMKRRYGGGKMMYQKCYNLLKLVREEAVRLEYLQAQYGKQSQELRSLIQMKGLQHRQFAERVTKMRKEMLYVPWLMMDKVESLDANAIQTQLQLAYDWETLRKEQVEWQNKKKHNEKAGVAKKSFEKGKKKLEEVKKELKKQRLEEKEWKNQMLLQIMSQTETKQEALVLGFKQKKIEFECAQKMLDDEKRFLAFEKDLLHLEQKHVAGERLEIDRVRQDMHVKESQLEKQKQRQQDGPTPAQSGANANNNEALQQEKKRHEAVMTQMRKDLQAKTLALNQEQKKRMDLLTKLRDSEEKHQTAEERADRAKGDSARIAQLEASLKTFRDKCSELESSCVESVAGRDRLAQKCKELEAGNKQLQDLVNQILGNGAGKDSMALKALEMEKNKFKNENESLKAEMNKHIETLNQVSASLERRATALEESERECMELEMKLQKLEQTKQDKRDSMNEFVVQLQDQMKNCNQQITDLQASVNESQEKCAQLEATNKKVEASKQALRETSKQLEREHKELRDYCDYLEDHNKEVEQQFNEILQANLLANEEVDSIQRKNKQMNLSMEMPPVPAAALPNMNIAEHKYVPSVGNDQDDEKLMELPGMTSNPYLTGSNMESIGKRDGNDLMLHNLARRVQNKTPANANDAMMQEVAQMAQHLRTRESSLSLEDDIVYDSNNEIGTPGTGRNRAETLATPVSEGMSELMNEFNDHLSKMEAAYATMSGEDNKQDSQKRSDSRRSSHSYNTRNEAKVLKNRTKGGKVSEMVSKIDTSVKNGKESENALDGAKNSTNGKKKGMWGARWGRKKSEKAEVKTKGGLPKLQAVQGLPPPNDSDDADNSN